MAECCDDNFFGGDCTAQDECPAGSNGTGMSMPSLSAFSSKSAKSKGAKGHGSESIVVSRCPSCFGFSRCSSYRRCLLNRMFVLRAHP